MHFSSCVCVFTCLDISVQVPELLHGRESLNASPAGIGEEVNWTGHIRNCWKSQEKVQLCRVYLFVHYKHLRMCM